MIANSWPNTVADFAQTNRLLIFLGTCTVREHPDSWVGLYKNNKIAGLLGGDILKKYGAIFDYNK
jgi:hypothetical protein